MENLNLVLSRLIALIAAFFFLIKDAVAAMKRGRVDDEWISSSSSDDIIFIILFTVLVFAVPGFLIWYRQKSSKDRFYEQEIERVKRYVEAGEREKYLAVFKVEKEMRKEYGKERKYPRPTIEEFEEITGIKVPKK